MLLNISGCWRKTETQRAVQSDQNTHLLHKNSKNKKINTFRHFVKSKIWRLWGWNAPLSGRGNVMQLIKLIPVYLNKMPWLREICKSNKKPANEFESLWLWLSWLLDKQYRVQEMYNCSIYNDLTSSEWGTYTLSFSIKPIEQGIYPGRKHSRN